MARTPSIRLALALPVLCLSACGAGDFGSGFEDAARKQSDIDNYTLSLWKRSPIVDAQNSSLSATSDLSLVPRTSLSFKGINGIHSALGSPQFKVYRSTTNLSSPVFYDFAGTDISPDNSAFQAFMSWHHAEKARQYALANFDDIDFEATGHPVLPLTIYSTEEGDPTGTSYDPGTHAIYLFHDSNGALPKYRVADESDSVVHEFGHALQDTLNEPILQTSVAGFVDPAPVNRDLDAILEGLADFNAASVAGDPAILPWLAKNLPTFLQSLGLRTGDDYYIRTLSNRLSLEASTVREGHLDGRILAGMLNDFRLYLTGTSVSTPATCTSGCTGIELTSGTVSSATAFARVHELAHRAYEAMSTTSTFFDYALLLIDRCENDVSISAWCTATDVEDGLVSILESRGFKTSTESASDGTVYRVTASGATAVNANTSIVGATPEITFTTGANSLGWMPFPNDTGFANSDSAVDPCEVLLVYPNFTLSTGATSMYDFTVTLTAVANFTNVIAGGTTVEQVTTIAQARRKAMPWMTSEQNSDALIDFVNFPSTTLYNLRGYSSFTQKLSGNYYPSDVGWLVRAPTSGSGSLTMTVTARRKTVRSSNKYMGFTGLTQSLTVSGSGDFCN